jgi:23S rRNA (guanosine2251-2'-O)-methyltransferase
LDLALAAGVPLRWVPRAALDAAARTDAPQGVLARAEPLAEVELLDVASTSDGRPAFLVVLDGVTDPHNLGAVMRCALGAGANGVVIARHRAVGLTPTVIKAAAGAAEYLPVAVVGGVPTALAELRRAGVWTVGLDGSAATRLWDLDVSTEAVAIVLGAEGRGLSRLARERCDVITAIPLAGPLDSLNVSAAAALACFEVARRRAQG